MANSVQEAKVEQFKWGIKRGKGGTKKDVQFYESFIYDGEEYSLYDSVYLHKDGAPVPYIGKIIKIWEHANKIKRVKVLWFFRPSEVSNYLGDQKVLENELFLASGDGIGLTNINQLEVIAGKCNVVCISKDARNRRPSVEELEMADHLFYRTFDVEKLTISDKLGEKIAAVEVKYLLNKNDPQKFLPREIDYSIGNDDTANAAAVVGKELIPQDACPGSDKAVKDGEDLCASSVKAEICEADLKCSLEENGEVFAASRTAAAEASVSDKPDGISGESPRSLILKPAEVTEMQKSNMDVDKSSSKPSEKTRVDSSIKPSEDSDKKAAKRTRVDSGSNGLKDITETPTVNKKAKLEFSEDPQKLIQAAKTKSTSDTGALEEKSSMKRKYEDINKPSVDNKSTAQKSAAHPHANVAKASATGGGGGGSEIKTKGKLVKDSLAANSDLREAVKPNDKIAKLSNERPHKAITKQPKDKDIITYGQVVEVTRKPDADRSKWFTGLPWEDRMKAALGQGKLVLLQNLDPNYTSSEVEDIVWHGCRESCTAKMLQRTATSSPHAGQAFAIFKSKEAAENTIRKLEQGCLMLPNGRPLVGSVGAANFAKKQLSFPGHLITDKLKLQMQKEKKDAVSTSHSSQPNSLEYDMAMEWRLLQARSSLCWRKLYKKQGEELKKLKEKLKSK